MSEMRFKNLAKIAAKKFLETGTPLNESIIKLAKEHNLNADQVARVCENANLEVYLSKMAAAKDRRFEFEVADKTFINKALSQTEKKAKIQERKLKDIDYFIKTATVKNKSSVFAPEYDFDASFLKDLFQPKMRPQDIVIKTAAQDPAIKKAKKANQARKEFIQKREQEKKAAEISAQLTINKLALCSNINKAINLIKQAALSSNPFMLWSEYASDTLEGHIANKLFSKVAKDLMSRDKNSAIAMLTKAKQAMEHSDYLKENNVTILNREPIIATIDNISRYTKLIDKLERLRQGDDGIYERSSTPNPNVDHTITSIQKGTEYHKALIDKYFPEAIGD